MRQASRALNFSAPAAPDEHSSQQESTERALAGDQIFAAAVLVDAVFWALRAVDEAAGPGRRQLVTRLWMR